MKISSIPVSKEKYLHIVNSDFSNYDFFNTYFEEEMHDYLEIFFLGRMNYQMFLLVRHFSLWVMGILWESASRYEACLIQRCPRCASFGLSRNDDLCQRKQHKMYSPL